MSDLTAAKIFAEDLPNRLASNPSSTAANAVYQFNIDGANGGTWTVDLTKEADFVTEGEAGSADCTITMKESDFVDMWTGKLKGAQAFMMGKLKIQGNMGLAMKLQSFLG
jgi:putative sterol carrier protein